MKLPAFASLVGLAGLCQAVTLYQADTFQDGTLQNWEGGTLMSNEFGGPNGASDRYLRLQSFGGQFAGSRMATYNLQNFSGNYNTVGVTAIKVFFWNQSSVNLQMRLALHSDDAEWTSSVATLVAPNTGWREYTFQVNSSAMTRVGGTSSFTTTLNGITRLQFRHQTGSPSTNGTAIAAVMGMDRVQAVPEPATMIGIGLGVAMIRRKKQ